MALTDEASPACVLGGFEAIAAAVQTCRPTHRGFRTGDGHRLARARPRTVPGHRALLPSRLHRATSSHAWIPALDGVDDKLRSAGARSPTSAAATARRRSSMAQAFPRLARSSASTTTQASIEARPQARSRSRRRRPRHFEVAAAQDFPATDYDLVALLRLPARHGRPGRRRRHVRESLDSRRHAGCSSSRSPATRLEDNLNPVGRVFYSASTLICTPASLSQEVGAALGAQAGEARLRDVAAAAGFTRFRRAAGTPFNMVLQAQA